MLQMSEVDDFYFSFDLAKNIIIHHAKKSIQLSNSEFSLLAGDTMLEIIWLIWKFEQELNDEVFHLFF